MTETNGNKRIQMKGMRSEDITKILTFNGDTNFKEFKELQSDQLKAHKEGCKFISDYSYCLYFIMRYSPVDVFLI